MSAAQAVLGNIRFAPSRTVRASNCVRWDAARDRQMMASGACVIESLRPIGVVVELKPRDFRATAVHFLSTATPIAWPVDEHDID